MKFGLFFEFEVEQGAYDKVTQLYDDIIAQICYAEEHGFDSCWIVEHHFTDRYSWCSAPEVLLGSLSRITTTVRLGSAVCLLPFHNPITIAERYAVLDQLSHGRVEFGIGRGVSALEWNTFRPGLFAQPGVESRPLMYEAMEVVQKCWTLERFTHEGNFFSIKEPINVIPKPFQKPHPRIHVAGGSPDSYGLYAEKGWNLLGFSTLKPLTDVEHDVTAFRQAWKHSPRTDRPGEFSELAFIRCANTEREADEPLVPYHKWLIQRFREFYFPNPQPGITEPIPGYYYGEPAYADFKKQGMVVTGTPNQVINQLKTFQRYDVDRVMCQFRIGLMPHAMVMETMRMFCKEVLPAFN